MNDTSHTTNKEKGKQIITVDREQRKNETIIIIEYWQRINLKKDQIFPTVLLLLIWKWIQSLILSFDTMTHKIQNAQTHITMNGVILIFGGDSTSGIHFKYKSMDKFDIITGFAVIEIGGGGVTINALCNCPLIIFPELS